MQIIIVHDEDKNETIDNAKELERLIEIGLHHDAWEHGIEHINFEFDIVDAALFDYKCPDWFN